MSDPFSSISVATRGLTIHVLIASIQYFRFSAHFKPKDSLDRSYNVWKIKYSLNCVKCSVLLL